MQATSEARLTALQTSAADHQSRLATLEASLQSIRNNTDSRLALLNSGLDSLDQRVATLESAQSNTVNVSEMHQQLQLLRSMQLLLRAQFYLSQDNYGLAAQDLQTASDVLGGLYSSLSADEADTAREVVGYLESALSDLPSRPVVANDKISTAWQILLFYLQKPAATPTPTPTAASTTEATTISIPAPVGTPTPTATAKP
jgi:chromosome segregation ATPase